MDGALNKVKSRVDQLQTQLQPSNKKLKGSARSDAESELKHLVDQMGAAQHDIESNKGKTQQLLSQKQNLSQKIEAKKNSLAKFKSGAL